VNEPCVVALGGGGFAGEEGGLRRFILELTGVERPRACYLPTAGGDSAEWIELVRERVAGMAELSVLTLFHREVSDIAELLLSQDVIYVGGGNTANMLVRRLLDRLVRARPGAAEGRTRLPGRELLPALRRRAAAEADV
jgi:dipeptidase E